MKNIVFLAAAAALVAPAAGQDAPAAPAQVGEGKDKLVCKREVPIGSLIASRKRCMTATQWENLARDHNDEARRMQMEFATRSRGN